MKTTTFKMYFYLFFLASVLGFLWEVLLYFVLHHSFVNRGFFYGPWLPVYGAGAVLLEAFLQRMHIHRALPVFAVSALTCSTLEYLLGAYLAWYRGLRYWDYSHLPFHLNGHICLYSFLGFGIAGALLHRFVSPHLHTLAAKKLPRPLCVTAVILCLLFAGDFLYSCYAPNTGNDICFSVWLPLFNDTTVIIAP